MTPQPRYCEFLRSGAKKDNRTLVTLDIDRRFSRADGKRGGRRTLQAHIGPELEKKLNALFNEIMLQ